MGNGLAPALESRVHAVRIHSLQIVLKGSSVTEILVLVLSPQDGAPARTRCSEKAEAMRSAPLFEHEHRFAEHEYEYENCSSATGISLIPLKPARTLETLLRRDKEGGTTAPDATWPASPIRFPLQYACTYFMIICMKTRVTLTVDPRVSHRAKNVARRQGISLSALVEKLLTEAAGPTPKKRVTTFSQRWKGKMHLATRSDERSARLHAKYKLTK